MPNLKEFRNRIASVKSTKKITSAMKMVAASKLRHAQSQAEESLPYARRMADMMSRLVINVDINDSSPVLIAGTGKTDIHLLIVITSDRGLCGGFNSSIARMASLKARDLIDVGKEVKIICVGRKGHNVLKRSYANKILHMFESMGRKRLDFKNAQEVSEIVLDMAERREFDVCSVFYNQFDSVMAQTPTVQQLVPIAIHPDIKKQNGGKPPYEFEPSEREIFNNLLPYNLTVQIFRALLNNAAGEQAARMTAMDNATNNAGDMIDKLTLSYNRARQAYITKELIEIISGAEAV